MMNVSVIESIAQEALFNRLKELKNIKQNEIIKQSPEINKLKIRLSETDNKISTLMNNLANGESITIEYINQFIKKLDTERKSILDNIAELELKSSKTSQSQFDIDDIIKNWDNYDIELKKSIAKNVIDVIILEGKNVDIKFF